MMEFNSRQPFGSFSPSLAARMRQGLQSLDPRFLIPLCAVAGLAAWLVPRWMLGFFFFPALALIWLACRTLPEGTKLLRVYALFSLFWALSHFLLQLWEHPGGIRPALEGAGTLGVRLFVLFGLALGVSLSATALTLGRVLAWYLQRLAVLEEKFCALPFLRGRLRPRLTHAAWRSGLALAVMAAFLPRTFRTLRDLRRTLHLRAPRLSSRRRLILLGLASLRLIGIQAWSVTLSVASRDLYRPLPWTWRRDGVRAKGGGNPETGGCRPPRSI
jgi:hypothetical protein